jgi:hypothetical protein
MYFDRCTSITLVNAVAESTTGIKTDTKEKETGALELLEWSVEADEYFKYVVGVVANNTARDFEFVSITFGTYDADGFKIGETSDIGALLAGEKWKLKAMVLEDNATSVKMVSIDSF